MDLKIRYFNWGDDDDDIYSAMILHLFIYIYDIKDHEWKYVDKDSGYLYCAERMDFPITKEKLINDGIPPLDPEWVERDLRGRGKILESFV